MKKARSVKGGEGTATDYSRHFRDLLVEQPVPEPKVVDIVPDQLPDKEWKPMIPKFSPGERPPKDA